MFNFDDYKLISYAISVLRFENDNKLNLQTEKRIFLYSDNKNEYVRHGQLSYSPKCNCKRISNENKE